MRKINTKLGSRSLVHESFSSMNELIDTIESRDLNGWAQNIGSVVRKEGRSSFRGVSMEEGRKYTRFGYDNKKAMDRFSEVIHKLDQKKLSDKNKSVSYHHVAGGKPIVANALMGLPKSMIARKTVAKKARIVNILIEGSFSAGLSSSELIEWGSELVANIVNLEKQGWRVKLQIVQTFGEKDGSKQIHSMKVVIKDENQPLDLKRLIFPLTHVGFFRSVGFDWYETLPESEQLDGYGRPVYLWSNNSLIDKYLQTIGGDNYYYIKFSDNVKEILKNVK